MPQEKKRRTKIVCTIGPSSTDIETLKSMMRAGMNVARLNFSHGAHKEHRTSVERIRAAANEVGVNVGIMMDLQGPKIRTGRLAHGTPIRLVDGTTVTVTTRDVLGDATTVSTTYDALPKDVKQGDCVYISDGLIELEVLSVEGHDILCRVIHGGMLGERKGINLPGVNVSAASLTPKDIEDLEAGLMMDVDFVALSFVRDASDVEDLRRRIDATGKTISIVAKIERPEGVKNFDAILEVTDVVMLARGDLGIEVPFNEVPQIQKSLILKCNDRGTPVITATQMLESMVSSPRPTRAEVADVANAVYDGTDALMLSGETASGDFPVAAVRTMARIAVDADAAIAEKPTHDRILRMRESGIRSGRGSFGDAIAQSACRTASAIGATRIVCFTKLGFTAALIARFRPGIPITAITLNEEIRRRCSMIWGVEAIESIDSCDTDEVGGLVDDLMRSHGLAKPGDCVVIAGGFPLSLRTRTNMLKLHRIGGSAEQPV